MELTNYLQSKNFQPLKRKINPRFEWCQATAEKLGVEVGQVLKITEGWPEEWIKDHYLTCAKSDNFGRLWWGLIKKQNEKQML